MITIWHGAPSEATTADMNLITRSFISKASRPITSLMIVEPSSPPPNDLARKGLATFSRELVPKMALAIVLAEGGGFRAALVRGVGITLTAMMPHRLPFKFVSDIETALVLLGPHLIGTVEGLRDAVGELRESIRRHAIPSPRPRQA